MLCSSRDGVHLKVRKNCQTPARFKRTVDFDPPQFLMDMATEYTEWQWPRSGLHYWKNQPSPVRVGGAPPLTMSTKL
jgi:hypothetical protein